jgi:hypothetical protein
VSEPSAGLRLGFLSVPHDAAGYTGGYLVTNAWGRPLEFRLTTPVQPNRVQEILYGATLVDYIHADLIGKTLVDKTSLSPSLIITDAVPALGLRHRIDVPVVAVGSGPITITHPRSAVPLVFLLESDTLLVESLLNQIDASVDLAEPFARIREAMAEARRPGVLTRAAA